MNRVDFYQADTGKLTIPAGGACVLIEGRVCPELEVVEIYQGGMGKFGSAKLRWQTSNGQIEDVVATGKEISIKWLYNNLYPAGGAEGILIFAGRVERIDKELGPDGEIVEVIARDFSSVLERITVFGRHIRDIDERTVFIESAGTVFNEAGSANATKELVEHKGRMVRLFATGSQEVKLWDCADVISYLLCEYVPVGELALPDEERLLATAGSELVRDLDVTGLRLLDAIGKCCEQAGLEFKFVPRLSETGPKQAIVFFRKGFGRSVELNLQQPGEKISVSKTNIWKATSRKVTPVTHRYTGLGDYKIYEATFNLVRSWLPEDESVNYEDYSPSTNPDFYKVKNGLRKWCLNEAGDYTVGPYH